MTDDTTNDFVPVRPGDKVAQYEIVGELGRGGMGVVFRARDTHLRREVALKCPWPRLALDSELRRRFVREARTASRLNHPNIVPVYEVFEHDGLPWLAMGLVEGTSLRERLRGGPLALPEALGYAIRLAEALGAAHAARVLHRDLSPKNVLIAPDGRVLVTDFGLARFLEPLTGQGAGDESQTELTRSGHVVGTPGYMSPEQALSRPLDGRSDLFSLGSVLYEMCAGRPAFRGPGPVATLDAVIHEEPPALSTLRPEVPEELDEIVRTALSKQPDNRYQDAAAMLADLRTLRRRLEYEEYVTDYPTSFVSVVYRRRRRRRYLAAAAAGALGMVAIVLVVLGLTESQDDGGDPLMRALITWPGDEANSRISPDREWVSFTSDSTGERALWIRKLSGGEPLRLTSQPGEVTGQAWSPDGREIAFLVDRAGDVFLQTIAATGGPPILSVRLDDRFRFGRIVRWISSNIYLESRETLWRYETDTGSIEQVALPTAGGGRARGFDVRRDEKRIAYAVVAAERSVIWVADLDGRTPRQVTSDEFMSYVPLFRGRSADELVFASNRSGQIDLWTASIDGKQHRRVTFSRTIQVPDDVSTDGLVLTFTDTEENANLWIADPEDRMQRWQITADAREDFWPSVSNTGALAFHRRKPSQESSLSVLDTELLLGELQGRELRDVHQTIRDGGAARISPGGEWLACVRPADFTFGMWVKDLRSGHTWRVTDRFRLPPHYSFPVEWARHNLAWTPNGRSLYYVDADEAGRARIASIDVDADRPRAEVVAVEGEGLDVGDVKISPDGRWLGYVRVAPGEPPRSSVVVLELSSGQTRELLNRSEDVYLRGWTAGGGLLAVLATLNDDFSERTQILELGLDGGRHSYGVIDRAFAGTLRLDRGAGRAYLTKVDDEGVAHNIYTFALADGKLRRLTDNQVRGITFSGLEVLPDGRVAYSRHEKNTDIWTIQFDR